MNDTRLYQLIEHLRKHGVGVCPGLSLIDGEWLYTDGARDHDGSVMYLDVPPFLAHSAIVVWCQNEMLARPRTHAIAVYHTEPHTWLLAVAHARGVAVPEEMKGADDEG